MRCNEIKALKWLYIVALCIFLGAGTLLSACGSSKGPEGYKPVCGNHFVQIGEQCDPPEANLCTPRCIWQHGPCGDGYCQADEDAKSCGEDCEAVCGDGLITHEENHISCPEDCPETCGGDDLCTENENAYNCPQECGPEHGDGWCTHNENAASAPDDCRDVRDDGYCTHDENPDSTPEDCGPRPNDGYCSHDENAATDPAYCPQICGDGLITHDENADNCPTDCPAVRDDGFCTHSERAATSPNDCGDICGDGDCTHDENYYSCHQDCIDTCEDRYCQEDYENPENCPQDCGGRINIGDGYCDRTAENADNAPEDCEAICGDGWCTHDETATTCTVDCGNCMTSDISIDLGGESEISNNGSGHDGIDAACVLGASEEIVYEIIPDFNGDMVVSLVNPGTTFDTGLAVREGSCDAGMEIACNDDSYGLRSQVEFPAVAGTPYYAIVEGFNGRTGDFELTAHRKSVCEGVSPILEITPSLDRTTTRISTVNGVSALSGICGGSSAPEGLLSFVAERDGNVVATTNLPGTTFDTLIYAREADCDSQTAELACNDDSNGVKSWIEFPVRAGSTYHILVDGFGQRSGTAEVAVGYGITESPHRGSLGGPSSGFADVYAISVRAGDVLNLSADTVAPDSAGDLVIDVFDSEGQAMLGHFDDQMGCTYPPPVWACPMGSIVAPNTGLIHIHVYSLSSIVNPSNIEYELTVQRNGSPQTLIQTVDQ